MRRTECWAGRGRLRFALVAFVLFAISSPAIGDDKTEIRELREMVKKLQRQVEELRGALAEPKDEESQLKDQVKALREEVERLSARTVPVEPVEEIKKLTEWVCERGHVFSSAPEGERCPYDQTPVVAREQLRKVKLARRESLSEQLEARLEEESRRRVAIGLSATGIVQQTAGAGPDRLRGEGSFDVLLISRPASETVFFADLEAIGGNGPDGFTGSASGLNADAGSLQDTDLADRVTVREAWLQTHAFGGRLSALAGKIDLTNYFDRNGVANDETTQFLSAMFVNNPLLGKPVEGSGHQANAPGVDLGWDTFRGLRFGVGMQAPRDSGAAVGRTPFVIGEIDYSAPLLDQQGNYRIWGRRNAGDDHSGALGTSIDQALGAWLRGFARYGFQTGGRQRDRHAWSVGVGIRSPLVTRPRDETGIAYGWERAPNGRAEDVGEVYHRFFLTDHLSVSPIGQYAFDLAGNDEAPPRHGVFLGGLRAQVGF